jgi:hypothetical protein
MKITFKVRNIRYWCEQNSSSYECGDQKSVANILNII